MVECFSRFFVSSCVILRYPMSSRPKRSAVERSLLYYIRHPAHFTVIPHLMRDPCPTFYSSVHRCHSTSILHRQAIPPLSHIVIVTHRHCEARSNPIFISLPEHFTHSLKCSFWLNLEVDFLGEKW